MPKAQNLRDEREKVAQEYIDKVAAINRRYGMGDRIPAGTYKRAVEAIVRLLKRQNA